MTTPQSDPVPWFVRAARVGAVALTALAILSWITPVNVRSQNGVFGCGSPADPKGGTALIDLVCVPDLDLWRTHALVLILAAGATLLVSEVLAPRWRDRSWLPGLVVSSPVGFAVVALSTGWLFTVIGGTGPSGAPFRCGTAMAPAVDSLSDLVCGQLADARRTLGLGGIVVGLGILLAGAYLSPAKAQLEASAEPAQRPEAAPRTEDLPRAERDL